MKFSYSLLKKLLPKVPPKKKLTDVFGLKIFEIEGASGDTIDVKLPSNRYSDAASHIGIARETAAVFNLPFKLPEIKIVNAPENKGYFSVDVRDAELCPRYSARFFELPKKTLPTPPWMKKALLACGIRPINPIVDVMNYVMIETGQPMHAFDADLLCPDSGGKIKIIVRIAKNGEEIETLDGQKIILDGKILVIADSSRPIAIAGIKGGKDTGVTSKTKRIIVEAANFSQPLIQKASRRLKLPTDAALRFGHGMSASLVDAGLDRATIMLKKAGALLKDTVHVYPRPEGDELIVFSAKNYEELIGAPIKISTAKRYFESLGFGIAPFGKNGDSLMVRVPAWRNDISIPEDLIEEAARLSGYDELPSRAPLVAVGETEEDDGIVLKDRIRDFLVKARISEINTHGFIPRQDAEHSLKTEYHPNEVALVQLANPFSPEYECLRPSIKPGLIEAVRKNARYFAEVRAFEIGEVFAVKHGLAVEEPRLGIVMGKKKDHSFFELKGAVSDLLSSFGITDLIFAEHGSGLCVESERVVLGKLDQINGEKGWEISVAEIYLDKLLKLVSEERHFTPLPKYPAITRDVSLLVSRSVKIGSVLSAMQEAAPKYLDDVDLIDQFFDEAKTEGGQSLTFRMVFQSEDHTLTDKEVNEETEKILSVLKGRFRAEAR